mmetsp:Transcript_32816/g.70945  ORF Transcript_32816/g.70945 Transcript_32816/m.70945 type:complete len:222 (-) Transcript_32816:751-1416(-)
MSLASTTIRTLLLFLLAWMVSSIFAVLMQTSMISSGCLSAAAAFLPLSSSLSSPLSPLLDPSGPPAAAAAGSPFRHFPFCLDLRGALLLSMFRGFWFRETLSEERSGADVAVSVAHTSSMNSSPKMLLLPGPPSSSPSSSMPSLNEVPSPLDPSSSSSSSLAAIFCPAPFLRSLQLSSSAPSSGCESLSEILTCSRSMQRFGPRLDSILSRLASSTFFSSR